MSLNKLLTIIILMILIILCIVSSVGIIKLSNEAEVKLIGEENIEVKVNEEYNDEGIIINNDLEIKDYEIEQEGNIDTTSVGEYEIIYKVKYKNKEYELKRTINVIDDIKPIITTNIESIKRDYCTSKEEVKLKYEAIDNYDGDITSSIVKEEKDSSITLSVKDSSGNENSIIIPISYTDKPSSSLKLIGNKRVYVPLNGKYKENGAKYDDGCGNSVKKDITKEGSVDVNTIGEYKIVYKVDNKKVTRAVSVYEPKADSNTKGKIIYLTFDDGPGAYTNRILNTLDKYNVKATFFVTHQFPSYENMIAKEYKKGHAVAVHTYSHNYKVYTSVDTYLKDFNKINDVIEKQTGIRSKIFRFPGGSSNTVSYNYSVGIMTKLSKQMTKDGYIYFDWNVSSGDAAGVTSSNRIYNNVVNGVKYCDTCVVLMHDIKYDTMMALDDILNTLTSRGYKFGIITESTPVVHHGINN